VGKVTKSIEIEASPEEVFNFINDMEKMNKARAGFTEGEYTSKGPAGVGSTSHYVGKAGGSQAEWDMEITEFVKNKKVSARTIGASKFKMKSSWTLEPTTKGTQLTYSMDYELPYSILGKVVDKLSVGKDADRMAMQQLENVKKALEA
jgi:carbon monoxide dehydrogenase subunit G